MRATKPITLATAKAVAAGNSCRQDDVIVAANVGRKAISDMLTTCKVKKKPYSYQTLRPEFKVIHFLSFPGCRVCCRNERTTCAHIASRPRDGFAVPRTAPTCSPRAVSPQSCRRRGDQKQFPDCFSKNCTVRHQSGRHGRTP